MRPAFTCGADEIGLVKAEVTSPDVRIPDQPYGMRAENLPSNHWLFTRERLVEELRGPRRVWFVGLRSEVGALVAEGLPVRVIDTLGDACLATNVE